ncbi:hypothetical protein ACFFJI_12375 [Allobacillus sp. GCM10007491]|uniref:Uncharacterized protein n=1 Tax=Allobacillus saliphilus TaxID=2912308 RepID=A0A941CXK1_9BACI|nr:hypothetical protein [Allobacillus saliphilus]MBR7554566.1 hypothetical protein [Allobacillus saliphilus]
MDEEVQRKVLWIIGAIIIGITGVLAALIGPNMILYFLYEHNQSNVFLIEVPVIANLLLGFGTLAFVLFCILMVFERKIIKAAGILMLVIGLSLSYVSFNLYNMFSGDEITIKKPLDKEVFSWSEIENADFIYDETTNETEIAFQLPDEEKKFILSQKHAGDVGTMKVLLKRNDVPYEEKEA